MNNISRHWSGSVEERPATEVCPEIVQSVDAELVDNNAVTEAWDLGYLNESDTDGDKLQSIGQALWLMDR